MHRLLILPILSWLILVNWTAILAQNDTILLNEAIASGSVETTFEGRSIAYTQPMLLATFTNLTDETLTLSLTQGQHLVHENNHYAGVVLANDTTIVIEPNGSIAESIYAFSLESTRAFPAPDTIYLPSDNTGDPELMTLLQRIAEKDAEALLAAQLAVWMHADNESDFNTFVTRLNSEVDLSAQRNLTMELLGQPVGLTGNLPETAVLLLAVSLLAAINFFFRRGFQKTFDGYRLKGHVATGVKYHIRQAQQRGEAELLAIKEPIDATTENRCLREIEIREQISASPPHIVPLISSGYYAEDKNSRAKPYLVEKYIEGADLGKVLSDRSKLGKTLALEITSQLAIALSYLHERYGIIHRELQPSNILIDYRGNIWLTDFSTAIDPKRSEFTNVKRNEASTYYWLAPEMVARKQALYYANGVKPEPDLLLKNRQTDIFSLGVLLYQLTTGTPPFNLRSGQRLFDPLSLNLDGLAGLDSNLAEVIRRCLDQDPRARFNTILELEKALGFPRSVDASRQARAELGRIVQDVAVASH